MRRLLVAAMLAVGLLGGVVGYAMADIPDATPSTPDPSHTFYACTPANSVNAWRPLYALDKDQGNCPTGWQEVHLVPALP
jgi:hypothetical protein